MAFMRRACLPRRLARWPACRATWPSWPTTTSRSARSTTFAARSLASPRWVSLTDWIGKRINAQKGWTTNGITTVPIGGMQPARAAIKTGQLDGYIGALETGYELEENKEWRVITSAAPYVDHFITHVFFAREDLIAKRPERCGHFSKAGSIPLPS